MTKALDYLLFPSKRTVLKHAGNFVTAIDGILGPTWLAQQYWANDENKYYSSIVLTQVHFTFDKDEVYVSKEIEYGIVGSRPTKGVELYPKFILDYGDKKCHFCPREYDGISSRYSKGIATWTELDDASKVINGPTQVPWEYRVSLDFSSGLLEEAYWQNNIFCYWKRTVMKPGHGDIELTDLIEGFSSVQ